MLAIAKKIKEQDSNKKIAFGGSRTTGELGKKILETFPYIDFIVSGEGEEALYSLAVDFDNYRSISNLIFRDQNKIIWNQTENLVDLNTLPFPLFDSFFSELSLVFPELQQFFAYNGKIPIEISRGGFSIKIGPVRGKIE